jgi:hypothetical protein
MWQAVASIAALVTAVVGAGIGIAGFVRSAASSAAATGLAYMERALATQQSEITRQEGQIGQQLGLITELRARLAECDQERQNMAERLANIEGRMQ